MKILLVHDQGMPLLAAAIARLSTGCMIVRATEAAQDADVVQCRGKDGAGAGVAITASKPWKAGEDCEFMYLPAGVSTVRAGFRGEGIELTVEVDPQETAPVIKASMDSMQSAAPKQRPFGCIEHDEREASVWPKDFIAKEDGVYCKAEPSTLGERNVNGKIHRSWSPSFVTDADYARAKLTYPNGKGEGKGLYVFPAGIRGSATNPAHVVGIHFVIGTLTNKPAFRNIAPVKAKQAPGSEVEHIVEVIMASKPADEVVTAKHGEMTGRPSFQSLQRKVSEAIHEDPRFDTDTHGFPEGSQGDKDNEPYCLDILVPDEKGTLCAVIRTDDGLLVKHCFTCHDGKVTMAAGASEITSAEVVYASDTDSSPDNVIRAMWSDEARKAALEARDRGAHSSIYKQQRVVAGQSSDWAHTLSQRAHAPGGNAHHHLVAHLAHKVAAHEHRFAANQSGEEHTAAAHIHSAEHHEEASASHESTRAKMVEKAVASAKIKASDSDISLGVIRACCVTCAGDKPGHVFHGNQFSDRAGRVTQNTITTNLSYKHPKHGDIEDDEHTVHFEHDPGEPKAHGDLYNPNPEHVSLGPIHNSSGEDVTKHLTRENKTAIHKEIWEHARKARSVVHAVETDPDAKLNAVLAKLHSDTPRSVDDVLRGWKVKPAGVITAAKVNEHQSVSKTGKTFTVREHEDAREAQKTADKATVEAHVASITAKSVNEHETAAVAHQSAAALHRKIGDKAQAEYHNAAAEAHTRSATAHCFGKGEHFVAATAHEIAAEKSKKSSRSAHLEKTHAGHAGNHKEIADEKA